MGMTRLPDPELDTALAGSGDPNFVAALARGLELLRALCPDNTLLDNQEFARRTDFPKATVSRLAGTLISLGYPRYDDALGRYGLDADVLALRFAYLASNDVIQFVQPHMGTSVQRFDVSTSPGKRGRLDMVHLETTRHDNPSMSGSSGLGVGLRLSLLSNPTDRAYLASLPAMRRERLYETLRAQQSMQWAAEGAAAGDIAKTGMCNGYVMSLCDWHPAIHVCVVALFASSQCEPYVTSCSAPHTSADAERIRDELVPAPREFAARLGQVAEPAVQAAPRLVRTCSATRSYI